jgi:4-hydroxy-tetrahydrodipicolinate synthase
MYQEEQDQINNVIGMKEASGDLEQVMFIIRDKPKDFLVISGDDALTLPMVAAGADGVISVIGNAYPKEWASLVNYALKGDFENAKKLHYKLLPLLPLIFAEGNPAGIKSAMKVMGICEDVLRLPLTPVSKQLALRISQFVNF